MPIQPNLIFNLSLLIGLFCLYPAKLVAYEFEYQYQFQHINREQGLSQGTGYTINQDASGLIWIGTQEGLNRFDGRRMQVFKKSSETFSLQDSYIYQIKNDPIDPLYIWLGTHDGLHRYNRSTGQFQVFKGALNNPVSNNKIHQILFENSEFAWLATGHGLNYLNLRSNENKSFSLSYEGQSVEKINTIYAITKLNKKHLLLATVAGLFAFDVEKQQVVKHFVIAENPIIWQLHEGINGEVWIGTSIGLYRLSAKGEIEAIDLQLKESFSGDKNVYALLLTRDKSLWVGTGSGVFISHDNGKKFRHIVKESENSSSLINNTVWSIFEDRAGIIWIGTDNGISRHNPHAADFHLLTKGENNRSLSDPWVSSIYQRNAGPLWIGTNNGIEGFDEWGLRRWHFNKVDGLSSSWIYGICQQSTDLLWVGTYQGLNKVNFKTGEIIPLFDDPLHPLLQDKIWSLLGEDDSHIWAGTSDGLYLLDTADLSYEYLAKGAAEEGGLTDNNIYVLHKDSHENLWIGTSHGLNKRDGKTGKIKHFVRDELTAGSLHNYWITGIVSDKQERLWVATEGGLYWSNEGGNYFHKVKQFTKANQYVYAIEIDDENNLWFSTNSGLGRLSLTNNQGDLDPEKLKLSFYTRGDGLQNNEFNEFASTKDSHGNIYFGGVSGLNMIIPEEFNSRKESEASGLITGLEINGKLVKPNWQQMNSPLKNMIDWSDNFTLNYEQNYLTFYFAALDFADPKGNRMEYRLIGFDDQWKHTTDNQPFVDFQKLKDGNYILQLRTASARGEWNPDIASINFTILPPWWLSDLAYFFYVLLIISILSFAYLTNKRRLHRLQNIVIREQKVAAQLKEVDAMKDRFLANASHELKTPLNAIIGLSEYLLSENIKELNLAETKEALQMIESSGRRMNDLVEDILQCSTLSAGKIVLQHSDFNLCKLVHECLIEVSLIDIVQEIQFINQVKNCFVYADRNRVKQILINLLHNAVKFTQKGEIVVFAQNRDDKVEITVKDSGIGIDPKYHSKIFDAFAQVDTTYSRMYQGSGLGLSIVKQLVELHGGQVSINSELAKGTVISFTLSRAINDSTI